ncbi:MAG: hypothetical protein MJE77_40690 [Proteobacteria bacterium]|nr:hypothetical protein [Pseudomonadota bacterium]
MIEHLYELIKREYDPRAIIRVLERYNERMFCRPGTTPEIDPEPSKHRFSLHWYEELPGQTKLCWTTVYQLPPTVPCIFRSSPHTRPTQPIFSDALKGYVNTLVRLSEEPPAGMFSLRGFAGWRHELYDTQRLQQWTAMKRKLGSQQITLRTMEGFIDAIAREAIGERWTSMDLNGRLLRSVV